MLEEAHCLRIAFREEKNLSCVIARPSTVGPAACAPVAHDLSMIDSQHILCLVMSVVETYHIVHPTKQPIAALPLTNNVRIVLSLMPCAILLAREPTLPRLRTALHATEQRLRVPLVVFPQVASAIEGGFARAAGIPAAPRPIVVLVAPALHLTGVGRDTACRDI